MGTAAALLNNFMYHSILEINDGKFISAGTLTQIRARLDGVNYIFLVEISMVSCCDLYMISAQAAKAREVLDKPFGGITFIFSDNFTQLPPARSGPPLYLGNVGTQKNAEQSLWQQQSSIGKALWHQITTVVIFHQNM